MAKTGTRRVVQTQTNFLTEYMTSHSEFPAGRLLGQQGKTKSKQMWATLTEELNKLGPAKNVKQWMKAWADLKSRTRGKARKIGVDMVRTGNRPIDLLLTDQERKILMLIGPDAALGNPELMESVGPSNQNVTFNEKSSFVFVENEECVDDPQDGGVLNAESDPIPAASASSAENGESASAPSTSAAKRSKRKAGWISGRNPTEHFRRIKEAREKREKRLTDTMNQFLAIQNRQISDIQEIMANAQKGAVENEKSRLEIERLRILQSETTNAAIMSMSIAVGKLANALGSPSNPL